MVVTKPFSCGSPAGKGQQEAGPDRGEEGPLQGAARGHRKQLMVTMGGKKVKARRWHFGSQSADYAVFQRMLLWAKRFHTGDCLSRVRGW